jgi:hypothetical protein
VNEGPLDVGSVDDPPDHDAARRIAERYRRGVCVCCGLPLDDWNPPPRAIAETVMICGICVGREHYADDVAPWLLDRLVEGMRS